MAEHSEAMAAQIPHDESVPHDHDGTLAHTEVADHGGAELHVEPIALGLNPSAWVALAMLVLIAFAIFGAKVQKKLAGTLDSSIGEIRKQLDEAKSLRAEAEALRKEYSDKIANAEKDAVAMMANAEREAGVIIAKAESDATDMIARREKMAEEKISAAELSAVTELRAMAADAATVAARGLIRQNHSAQADTVLVNQAIAQF